MNKWQHAKAWLMAGTMWDRLGHYVRRIPTTISHDQLVSMLSLASGQPQEAVVRKLKQGRNS